MVREGLLTRAVLGLSACALAGLIYVPFVDSPFVLDDRTIVLLNPSLADPFDVRGIFLYDRWHPLVSVTFAIDRAWSGISPLGFRITNGVLHALVVALIFTLASRPSGSGKGAPSSFEPSVELTARAWAAFVAAAAFGLNPLTARSVAYLSVRADLLFTAGILLAAMLAWGAARARSAVRFAIAALVAGLALTAIPWGLPVPHGPPRFYVVLALTLIAAARLTHGMFARSRGARVAGALVAGALALPTWRTLETWSDPVALWRAQVERTPAAWDAHLGLADALREASHCAEATGEYEIALRLNPGQEEARRGLAQCGAR